MPVLHRIHQTLHDKVAFYKRARKISVALDRFLPRAGTFLDVGCGTGLIAHGLQELSPEREFEEIDVVARESSLIPCRLYDGQTIPFASGSFDYVLFVDVLHHMAEPEKFLSQARRIARQGVIVKDHLCENAFDYCTLAAMDWFGNAQYGIALPNNYKSRSDWKHIFERLGFVEQRFSADIGIYPFPANLLVGRGLHFIGLYGTTS